MRQSRNVAPARKGIRKRSDQPISDETAAMVRKYKKSAAFRNFKKRFSKKKPVAQ